jgi:hypothetical protein
MIPPVSGHSRFNRSAIARASVVLPAPAVPITAIRIPVFASHGKTRRSDQSWFGVRAIRQLATETLSGHPHGSIPVYLSRCERPCFQHPACGRATILLAGRPAGGRAFGDVQVGELQQGPRDRSLHQSTLPAHVHLRACFTDSTAWMSVAGCCVARSVSLLPLVIVLPSVTVLPWARTKEHSASSTG